MSGLGMLAHVQTRVNSLRNEIDMLQDDFERVIADKSISLNERWDLWKFAPSDLKHQSEWIESFRFEDTLGEISWFDELYVERHETVHMENLIDQIEETVGLKDTDEYYANKYFAKFTPELLADLKEEILEKNLESFVWDW